MKQTIEYHVDVISRALNALDQQGQPISALLAQQSLNALLEKLAGVLKVSVANLGQYTA